jgi:hypothetical protein
MMVISFFSRRLLKWLEFDDKPSDPPLPHSPPSNGIYIKEPLAEYTFFHDFVYEDLYDDDQQLTASPEQEYSIPANTYGLAQNNCSTTGI